MCTSYLQFLVSICIFHLPLCLFHTSYFYNSVHSLNCVAFVHATSSAYRDRVVYIVDRAFHSNIFFVVLAGGPQVMSVHIRT
ncbi:hypothetical protein C8R41DRAFT_815611 [Lentinula lateritia]|uniref:Secreted protein n=1 Tax=Lentinula lateritia TaxID=40482 RepID=A0ABQ8VW04_9AGAR|nr:hypothetical protein C8R41DRAFT_815611 [Lentinula lateritia]